MDLLVLDADFKPLGVVDTFVSLTWDRSYYKVGSFSLATDMHYYDLLRAGQYLYRNDAQELGLLQGFSYRQDAKTETIEVEGQFLEAILGDRVVEKTKDLKGTPEEISRQLVTDYCIAPTDSARKMPRVKLGALQGLGTSITAQCTGTTVLEEIQEVCQTQELAAALTYDYQKDEIVFAVCGGRRRGNGAHRGPGGPHQRRRASGTICGCQRPAAHGGRGHNECCGLREGADPTGT